MGKYFDASCAHCNAPIRARDKGRGQTVFFCSKQCRDAHWRKGRERPCSVCGKVVYRKRKDEGRRVYCSVQCSHKDASSVMKQVAPRREQRPNWKGGVTYRSGYKFIYMPDHPNANKSGYVAEHRYVMAEKIGRPLRKGEVVHHIDHNKRNNDPLNLVITRAVAHSRYHRIEATLGKSGWSLYPDGCK